MVDIVIVSSQVTDNTLPVSPIAATLYLNAQPGATPGPTLGVACARVKGRWSDAQGTTLARDLQTLLAGEVV
jgi:hypothetical protein